MNINSLLEFHSNVFLKEAFYFITQGGRYQNVSFQSYKVIFCVIFRLYISQLLLISGYIFEINDVLMTNRKGWIKVRSL